MQINKVHFIAGTYFIYFRSDVHVCETEYNCKFHHGLAYVQRKSR